MSVAHPLHLVAALLAAALAIAVFIRATRARRGAVVAYSDLAFLRAVAPTPAWLTRSLSGLAVLGTLGIAVSLAGPRLAIPVPVRDGTVILCIDTSGSMASSDVRPTRFAAAQAAARAFIAAAPPGTRIGVVAFSGSAGMVAPPQTDHALAAGSLDDLPPPNGPTAIGDAIALALRYLPRTGHRVVVVVTDGVNNAGVDPLGEAQKAGARGVRVYTVGIGTQDGAVVPGTGEVAGIDEDALRAYAAAAGGAYARAGSATALRDALARLGQVTSFERRNVDASLAFAVLGGLAVVAAAGTAFALGRFP